MVAGATAPVARSIRTPRIVQRDPSVATRNPRTNTIRNLHSQTVAMAAPGEIIANRYRLIGLLGNGGFGEVWRAYDQHRNYEVALKLIRNHDRGATWNEASVLTALRSEHILEVNNADVAVDVPYIDTALAECSVDALAMPLGAEPGLAVDWVRRALRGLDLCHKRGLVHRDVKPQNIFLTSSGSAKLGDLGIAALMDAAGTAEPHGDMRIRAPELFIGGRSSVRSDVYSMSCTLYGLVAGRLPYEAGDHLSDIVNGKHTPVRDLAPHASQALADRIRKGMALNPDDRFPSAAAFDNELALPERLRQFTPVAPHSGHVRCWTVTGRGTDTRVCVMRASRARRFKVETRYQQSGNRLTRHCFETTESQLPTKLRTVFNALRRATS